MDLSSSGVISGRSIICRDWLGSFFPRLMEPLEDGPTAGSVPDMGLMLAEFYALRGLDADGRPAHSRLEQLGLLDLANALAG